MPERVTTTMRLPPCFQYRGGPSSRFPANTQEPEIRITSSQPPTTWKSMEDLPITGTLDQLSTAGATPRWWPSPSPTAMPPPKDLCVVLMPWGPWHCHCKSGTMSQTRARKLHGLSGHLRVGALSQLRTEHQPCTDHQCPCDQLWEECPLDAGLCADTSCTTQSTASAPTSTSTAFPSLSSILRPSPFHFPSPSPALAFWRRVRIGLEDIWNSFSSVFRDAANRQKLEIMVTSRGVSISTSPPLSIPAPTGCLAQKNKTIKIPVWFCVFLEVSEGRGP